MEHVETSSFVKKSSSLIPQSVIKKQTQKAHSDDEDESGSFFTLDEPTLKETAEPLILPMTGMKTAYTTSVSMETTSTFTPMPTNQQYNLANVSNETFMAMNEPAPMELDMNEAVRLFNISFLCALIDFYEYSLNKSRCKHFKELSENYQMMLR